MPTRARSRRRSSTATPPAPPPPADTTTEEDEPAPRRCTQAIATFGGYGRPSDHELAVLELANEFRAALCRINHAEHRRAIHIRDRLFPDLFRRLCDKARIDRLIYELKQQIKAYHSEVRDRNAVTAEQEAEMLDLEAQQREIKRRYNQEKTSYYEMVNQFKDFKKNVTNWKNVKDLERRREAYAAIVWPDHIRKHALMWIELDLERRELNEDFQARGLHSAIRKEIEDASKAKVKKDGPGIRYRYHRDPNPKPWEKLTLQISGGITMQEAIDGRSRSLRLTRQYTNHTASGDHVRYTCQQQIGTKEHPRRVEYDFKVHRNFPLSARIQRWSLVIRNGRKRKVIPTLTDMDFSKRLGCGLLTFDITWKVVRGGVQICHFVGTHVNERLILPQWLVDKRMAVKSVQAWTDLAANDKLQERGISPSKQPGEDVLHGVSALEKYCQENPTDYAAANTLDYYQQALARAHKLATQAIGCIEKIYETAVRRICRLHSMIIPDTIDLVTLKKYDERDLLLEDRIPKASREYLNNMAPGKLKGLLKRYGLTHIDVGDELAGTERMTETTDLFSSWILTLGVKTGRKDNRPNNRSY